MGFNPLVRGAGLDLTLVLLEMCPTGIGLRFCARPFGREYGVWTGAWASQRFGILENAGFVTHRQKSPRPHTFVRRWAFGFSNFLETAGGTRPATLKEMT